MKYIAKKCGVRFQPPAIILIYDNETEGKSRQRIMPVRNFSKFSGTPCFILLPIFFKMYFYLCVCIYVAVYRDWKRASDSLKLELQGVGYLIGLLNLGTLQEQQMHLTIEPSPALASCLQYPYIT